MTRYALVIGIAQYDRSLARLTKPTKDAEAVASILAQPGYGDWEVKRLPEGWNSEKNCYEVAQERLNGSDLGQMLQDFILKQADRKDALIYFSGHGFTVSDNLGKKKGYLATSDCTSNAIATRGIALDSLNQLILESNLSSLVVLLDCCHAGSILESNLVRQSLTAFNSAQKDYYLIAACRDFESAWEGEEYSIFTAALLKGLGEENAGSDGTVRCGSLFDFIATELKRSGQEPIYMGWGRSIHLVQYQPKQKTVVIDETCPYQGLQAFEKEQARFFFGRDKVIQQLIQKLDRSHFIPIIGASGSGKSSVVQAGLIPALEKNGWQVLDIIKPGFKPLAKLERSFEQFFKGNESELDDLIHNPDNRLEQLLAHLAGAEHFLLVVDQFEEVFTVCAKEKERRRFIELLAQVAEIPSSRLAIVTTMRADFLEPCLNYESLTQLIQNQAAYMPPLVGAELEEAIVKPAELQGYQFESGLLAEILKDVGQNPGSLPLLQFALTELWSRDRQKHRLTLEQYQAMGGVIGALDRHAERVYQYQDFQTISPGRERDEGEKESIKRICLKLVRTGEGIKDTRQRQPKAKLLDIGGDNRIHRESLSKVLDGLVQGRLLVTGESEQRSYTNSQLRQSLDDIVPRLLPGNEGREVLPPEIRDLSQETKAIDLAHEALMEGWKRFAQWRQENRELRRLIHRIEDALKEWQKQPNDDNLMMGGLLAQARAKWLELTPDLDAVAKEFYQKSDTHEQDRIAELEQALTESRLREQAARVLNLLPVQPLDSLVLAIKTMGENAEKLPNQILGSVQTSLYRAMETVRVSIPFQGHHKSVTSVAFSPDGKMIVSGSLDRRLRLWDIQGNPISKPFWGHRDSVWCVAFSPDGQMIASGSYDGTVRLWNLPAKPIGQPFQGHGDCVWSVGFSPDGQMIVSGGSDNTVRLWDLHGNPIGQAFRGHEHYVTSVAFSPDGKMIVSGSNDSTIRLWNLQGEPIGKPFQGHEDSVCSVAFSPDSKMIVSGSRDKTVRLWDLETVLLWHIQGRPISKPFVGHEDSVWSVAFSPDGKMIVSGSNDYTIRLWDLQGRSIGQPLQGHEDAFFSDHCFWSVAFSPDGQRLVSSSHDKTVRLWDIKSHSIGQPLRGHENHVTSVAFSPDGKMIVSGSDDNTVRLWDIEGNAIGEPFQGHQSYVLSVAFSPDGQMIVSVSADGTVRLWNLQGNLIVPPFQGHQKADGAVAFSPNGRMIASGGIDYTVQLFDIQGKPIGQPFRGHQHIVNSLAFSPDGQTIVSGSWDNTVRLWDLQGNPIGEPLLGHESYVDSVAFSPDGQRIVSGSWDNTIRLWDLQGNPIGQPLRGHEKYVYSVAFSPDGQMIASGSRDKTVRLWDIDGRPIGQPLRGHESYVRSVAFSRDGQMIVSGSHDKTVRLWRGGWRAWLEVCCNRLRYHPAFKDPQTEDEKAACLACKKYVWGENE
jgi:WD40 repeat protein